MGAGLPYYLLLLLGAAKLLHYYPCEALDTNVTNVELDLHEAYNEAETLDPDITLQRQLPRNPRRRVPSRSAPPFPPPEPPALPLDDKLLQSLVHARTGTADELYACMNKHYTFEATTWHGSVFRDDVPKLKVEKLWWSSNPVQVPLTVVTQLSVDRIHSLWYQCSSHRGPLSAAVYMPFLQTNLTKRGLSVENTVLLQQAVVRLDNLFKRAESNSSVCQLDLMLVYEVFASDTAIMLYPVNALRNLARMPVRTKLLAAVDVDMLLSVTISQDLANGRKLPELASAAEQRVALVMPAFEPTSRSSTRGRLVADLAISVDKDMMRNMTWKERKLRQFKMKKFPRGHAPSLYRSWLFTHLTYPITYKRMYEPWYISHWDVMPWHDINFKGYGMNKIVHVASLPFYNFTFVGHGNWWLVHRPHDDTRMREEMVKEAELVNGEGKRLPSGTLYMKVSGLWSEARKAMEEGRYEPRVDPVMWRCQQELTWLQQPKMHKGYKVPKGVFS